MEDLSDPVSLAALERAVEEKAGDVRLEINVESREEIEAVVAVLGSVYGPIVAGNIRRALEEALQAG